MKVNFRNLGTLDEAQIELNKLTIVCGENNLGKTYLTYALYGFLSNWERFIECKIPKHVIHELRTEGLSILDLKTEYVDQVIKALAQAAKVYQRFLPSVLASSADRFSNTTIEFSVEPTDMVDLFKDQYEQQFTSGEGKRSLLFKKSADSFELEISSFADDELSADDLPERLIEETVKKLVWSTVMPRPFIASAERTGAITFRNELNLKRSNLLRIAHDMKADAQFTPFEILEKLFDHGYPVSVSDNVDFANRLSSLLSKTSELSQKNPELLELHDEIVGGKYLIKDGEVVFSPKSQKRAKLSMAESSSSVRSLVMLSYYLKHIARKGDLLIIDEPELNLHPSNQRKIARLIALIISSGIHVFVTTHSDYIIKEFNTLIMLNNFPHIMAPVKSKAGYMESEHLRSSDVTLYTIEKNKLYSPAGKTKRSRGTVAVRASIDPKYGIQADSFDAVINEMNKFQDSLFELLDIL